MKVEALVQAQISPGYTILSLTQARNDFSKAISPEILLCWMNRLISITDTKGKAMLNSRSTYSPSINS